MLIKKKKKTVTWDATNTHTRKNTICKKQYRKEVIMHDPKKFKNCKINWWCFKSTLTDINIAKPTFFLLLIAWNIFSKAYTWSLYMSLQLKCVSLGSIRFGLFCNPASHSVPFDCWVQSLYILYFAFWLLVFPLVLFLLFLPL